MKRFTKKLYKPIPFDDDCTVYYAVPKNHDEVHVATNMANKLGRLEDIEEDMELSLVEVLNIVRNFGIWIEYKNNVIFICDLKLCYNEGEWCFEGVTDNFNWLNAQKVVVPLKEYKKTWWWIKNIKTYKTKEE